LEDDLPRAFQGGARAAPDGEEAEGEDPVSKADEI